MYNLLLIGAGGYAKSVLDSVDPYNYNMVGFVDEFNKDKMHLGYPIIASSLDTIPNADEFVYFIAIGNNAKRKVWYDRLVERNLSIINVVDRTAIISPHAKIGIGCFVGRWRLLTAMQKLVHIAKLNGRICGAKRSHSVSEQPNCYQSVQSNPYNDSSHLRDGEYIIFRRIMYAVGLQGHHYQTLRAINVR